ncbi:TPA: DUF2560 family protein [Escherichia coli]
MRLNLLAKLNYDTAAAADAIKFVGDDPLKYQIFVNQLSWVTSESGLVARTTKAIKESEDTLLWFEAESGSYVNECGNLILRKKKGIKMPKNVIAILPGDAFDHVVVQDDLEIVTFRGDKGGVLTMPIEEYELDGISYNVARCDGMVTDEKVDKAIRHFTK